MARTLRWAAEHDVVVALGGGTSVVSGVTCEGKGRRGVISLDMTRMDRVREVDVRSMQARVEAGASGPRLESPLAAHGLTLRHFPQSFELSTLGGSRRGLVGTSRRTTPTSTTWWPLCAW